MVMEKVKRGLQVDGLWEVKTEYKGFDQGTKRLYDGSRMSTTWHSDE
jgi:hypothetical protein